MCTAIFHLPVKRKGAAIRVSTQEGCETVLRKKGNVPDGLCVATATNGPLPSAAHWSHLSSPPGLRADFHYDLPWYSCVYYRVGGGRCGLARDSWSGRK